MINYKNLLQECLQKKGYPIPLYDGNKNSSGWIGNVKIILDKKDYTFYGIECSTKKESQQHACFIDIENLSKYNYIIPNSYIYGFISTNSNLYNKIEDIKKYMNIYVYEGVEKDGSDVLLSMIISKNIPHIKKHKNKVTILTNDHFGKCIKRILEKMDISCEIKNNL